MLLSTCAAGEEIRAHKAILAVRSPVFNAMFGHKMSESLEGKVMIDDMPVAALRELIKCVLLFASTSLKLLLQIHVRRQSRIDA